MVGAGDAGGGQALDLGEFWKNKDKQEESGKDQKKKDKKVKNEEKQLSRGQK